MKRMLVAVVLGVCALLTQALGEGGATGVNLLGNPGFDAPGGRAGEIPDRWAVFAEEKALIGIVPGRGLDGSPCVSLGSVNIPRTFQGIMQTVGVEEGRRYTLSALVINNKEDPLQGSAYGQLVIEWRDAAGNEVGRTWGAQWKKNISRIRWELMSIAKVRAPESAVEAIIGIHLYEGIQSNGKGSFLVDGVSFVCEE